MMNSRGVKSDTTGARESESLAQSIKLISRSSSSVFALMCWTWPSVLKSSYQ